jgi:hypothetical protein
MCYLAYHNLYCKFEIRYPYLSNSFKSDIDSLKPIQKQIRREKFPTPSNSYYFHVPVLRLTKSTNYHLKEKVHKLPVKKSVHKL